MVISTSAVTLPPNIAVNKDTNCQSNLVTVNQSPGEIVPDKTGLIGITVYLIQVNVSEISLWTSLEGFKATLSS